MKKLYSQKVSVIVPMYHGRKYVTSLVRQIKENAIHMPDIKIQLVLYNDCPEEEIEMDDSEYQFDICVINAEQNAGIHGARVKALDSALGDYILFLDQDDLISGNYIESQFREIKDADAVVCRLINGNRLHYTNSFKFEDVITREFMLKNWCPIVSPGQVLLKKEAIPEIWRNNVLTTNGADDYFLWLCMMAEGKKFALNQEVLFEHIITGNNTSKNVNQMMDSEQEMIHILLESHIFSEEDEKYLYRLPDSLRKIHVKLLEQYREAYSIYQAEKDFFEPLHGLKRVAIYGAGVTGQSVFKVLKCNGIEPVFYIDRNAKYIMQDIPVYTIDEAPHKIEGIIISIREEKEKIKKLLKEKFDCPIYWVSEGKIKI